MVTAPDEEQNISTTTSTHHVPSGSVVVILFAAAVVLVIAYFALGMPGMGHGPSRPHDMENMQPATSGEAPTAVAAAQWT